jgi:hypothetical protein
LGIDPAIHALQHHDGGGMSGQVATAGQPGFGAGIFSGMLVGMFEQPVNAGGDGKGMNVHGERFGQEKRGRVLL